MRLLCILASLVLAADCANTKQRTFGPAARHTSETPKDIAAFQTQSASVSSLNLQDAAVAFAAHKGFSVAVTGTVSSPHLGLTHVHLVQTLDGVEIVNAVANANVRTSSGAIHSFTSDFYSSKEADLELIRRHEAGQLLDPLPALDAFFNELGLVPPSTAGASVSKHPQGLLGKRDFPPSAALPGQRPFRRTPDFEITLPSLAGVSAVGLSAPHSGPIAVPATLKYLRTDSNELVPVWDFEVDLGNNYYNAHVDARAGKKSSKRTLSLVDWVSENYFEAEAPKGDDEGEIIYERIVERVSYRGKDAKRKLHGKFKKGKKGDKVELYQKQKNKHQAAMVVDDTDSEENNESSSIHGVYNVYPLGTNDPLEGDRNLVKGPLSLVASPNGWHWCSGGKKQCPYGNHTVTIGNNVYAQENLDGSYNGWENKTRPDGTAKLIFDTPVDLSQDPETYVDAAVINLFYWNNAIHDLFYVYGFDEVSGNFQDSNLERGGLGGDSVIANAQDGSGHNNANFATPPDGSHGRMRMYVWDVTTPWRDGDFEGGIIMHEYAHGISTRLTGGPANSGCLGFGESGGMGEGWGDFFATALRMPNDASRDIEFGMGDYANGGKGIRRFKYSTNNETNPSVYSFVQKPAYWGVHAKGEVWAEILYEVYWNFVDTHGFNADWFDSPLSHAGDNLLQHASGNTYQEFSTGRTRTRKSVTWPDATKNSLPKSDDPYPLGGNVLILQLVVDGLKLQPCNPSFVDARDAIITAEELLTGGKNKCLIWKGFAKRGLGVGAISGGFDSFKLPQECM
ncbi:Fungalysin/Thermolysin Extracellular metalloproteinase 5 [Chytriomyces hyalinus]|nr:Fungalysin/Thermolysin Extracellular metalloproteinase 5 [Chytriomyces hyalinus]